MGCFDPQAAKAMPAEYVPLDSHRVRQGDLLLSRANTLALVGAVAISPADFPNRFLSDKLLRLQVDPALVLPEFLLFALRTATARLHIEENAAGTSDSMRNISQPALLQTPIALPDLPAQRRIVDQLQLALHNAGAAANACAEQVDTADLLRARLLAGAFGAAPVGVQAADKAQPGWRVGRLTELARLESGHTPQPPPSRVVGW